MTTHRSGRAARPRLAAVTVALMMAVPLPGAAGTGARAGEARVAPARTAAVVTVTLPTVTGPPGGTVDVPLEMDQDLSGLEIYSMEYRMPLDPGLVSGVAFLEQGAMTSWGPPFTNSGTTFASGLAVGFTPAASTSTRLHRLLVTISPSATLGADMPLTLSVMKFNEGAPAAVVVNGLLRVRGGVDVALEGARGFTLSGPSPNPARAGVRFAYTIPRAGGERMRLAIYSLDGRRIRTLAEGRAAFGPGRAVWDARDDDGRALPPGLYLCRLEWGARHLERKLALVR